MDNNIIDIDNNISYYDTEVKPILKFIEKIYLYLVYIYIKYYLKE